MQYQGAQPVETISAVTPAGSTTPSLTLFTAATWIKLFALVITYITQAATTPTVTITLQDANNNILWRKTAAALTAAATSTISLGGGLPDSTAVTTAQQLGIPTDMFIPPGGKIVVSATGANAADTVQTTTTFTV